MLKKHSHAFSPLQQQPIMILFGRYFQYALSILPDPSENRLQSLSAQRRKADSFFTSSQSKLKKARQFLSQKKYKQVIDLCTEITNKNPEHHWAWHGKGDAYQMMKQYKQSEYAYQQACFIQPKIALHWGGLANSLHGQGKTREADILWKKALGLDPSLLWMRAN